MLYRLEEILSFNLIYRMLGIDSGITEKVGKKVGIKTPFRNGGPSEWRTVGMADCRNGKVYRPVRADGLPTPATALRFPPPRLSCRLCKMCFFSN